LQSTGYVYKDIYIIVYIKIFSAYDLRKVQAKQEGLKLNGTVQVLTYGDVVISDGSICTIKKRAEASIVACKETGLKANADKVKYMVKSRDQHAGKNHSIKISNKSFETVEQFRYLGKRLTNQNFIHEEIKTRLQSGNACYPSVWSLPSSSLLHKNMKTQIYRNIFTCCSVCVCETLCLSH
jgi:hypothetical protein